MGSGMGSSFLTIGVTVVCTGIICYSIGLDSEMRNLVREKVFSKILKKTN
jgi:hypothetical protein